MSLLFAVMAIALPGITLLSLALLFGAYAFVDGIAAMVAAHHLRRQRQPWGLTSFEGVLGILAGAVAVMVPGVTILLLTGIAAAWALVTGIIEVAAAFRLKGPTRFARFLWAVGGALSIALGVVVLARPAIGVLSLLLMVASYSALFGITFLVLGIKAGRVARQRVILPPSETPADKAA